MRLLEALYSAPHGVVSMSRDLEGLVETSTNLASVKMLPRRKKWKSVGAKERL